MKPIFYTPVDLPTLELYQSRPIAGFELPPAVEIGWTPAEARQMQANLKSLEVTVQDLPVGVLEEYR